MPDLVTERADRIDRTRIEPVWEQVAADLRERIDGGELAAGHKLPSEQDLGSEYGVARMTVRKAIAALVDENRLVVIRGRGTYVPPR
jgi:GntR family transcriptional regulator